MYNSLRPPPRAMKCRADDGVSRVVDPVHGIGVEAAIAANDVRLLFQGLLGVFLQQALGDTEAKFLEVGVGECLQQGACRR